MLRVPGSDTDLFHVKAEGGDVGWSTRQPTRWNWPAQTRTDTWCSSQSDLKPQHPLTPWHCWGRTFWSEQLFVAGFTCSGAAGDFRRCSVRRTIRRKVSSHPATSARLSDLEITKIWCANITFRLLWEDLQPVDLLEAIHLLVIQLEEGRAEVENQYTCSVEYKGNLPAQAAVATVFEIADRKWRGIGNIPVSGLRLKEKYAAFDAERIFDLQGISAEEPKECISAEVLLGMKKPTECSAFGVRCTPEKPLGAPMVSTEGACAAYYQYRRHLVTIQS